MLLNIDNRRRRRECLSASGQFTCLMTLTETQISETSDSSSNTLFWVFGSSKTRPLPSRRCKINLDRKFSAQLGPCLSYILVIGQQLGVKITNHNSQYQYCSFKYRNRNHSIESYKSYLVSYSHCHHNILTNWYWKQILIVPHTWK